MRWPVKSMSQVKLNKDNAMPIKFLDKKLEG
jgi:hypothetical protein